MRHAASRRLLLLLILVCGIAAGSASQGAAQPDDNPAVVPVAAPPLVVNATFVLSDSALLPPAAQHQMLVAAAEATLPDRVAAAEAVLAPGGRVLHVRFSTNPFASSESPAPTADDLLTMAARVVVRWRDDLTAVANADARQRKEQLAAKQAQEMQIAKQKSLAAAARLDALKPVLATATDDTREAIAAAMREAVRDWLAALGHAAALKAADMTLVVPEPIRPEIVLELGDGRDLQRRTSGD
ncbi:MAG: hypothetical protein AB7K09_16220 [Planctomycetota bacterium]